MSGPPGGIAETYDRCAPRYGAGSDHFTVFGRRLVERAALRPGERVLDAAAGRGACLLPAAAAVGPAGAADGVDLSEAMVGHLAADAAARGLEQVRVACMDAHGLAFPEGSYDAALCGSALFVMADPDAAAAGFLRVLRPGGRCAVSVPAAPLEPDGGSVRQLYAEYARRAPSAPGFAMRFGMDPGALLRRAGFTGVTAVEEETTVYFRDAAAWWDWTWTVGTRCLYERLTDAQLDELRSAVLALLAPAQTPDGLPGTARAVFAIGTRPA